ncbi:MULTISPECIES: ribosome small subunit-dependent GTPase A [unclassified Streptomyces]|uniref:ribosome small subunit-dependent GTPase A n=1 Tax=unclassified Streptomyces TaxID=2593676 RepID=UPI001F5B93BE|nr:ribosome small subunit-dependent GTPase A [Streptomyces sp. HSG2]
MSDTSLDTFHGPGGGQPLAAYGWDDGWTAAFAPYAERGLVPGRVVRVDRGRCDVVTPAGTVRADTGFVVPRDPMEIVCTGDWVAVDPTGVDPRYVRTLLPRRTAFVRSTSSKRAEGQVLAANIDHVAVCVSLALDLDPARIERFLALALSSAGRAAPASAAPATGARPIVVLTKADLVPDPGTRAYLARDVEACAPGVPVLTVSAPTGEGLDVLAATVAGGTTVMLGQSGAGKSTLVNAILGRDRVETGPVREGDGKGRHTTTTRDLFVMPGGGALIDTPGLRGVGLWDASVGVSRTFADIEDLAARCRFDDCAHASEPGCAVLAAVEVGDLPVRRLESYRKLSRENRHIVAKSDARARAELRKEHKRRGAEGRAAMAAKRARQGR